ncbi:hypothetical protein MMC07_002547 [Pseudocyphellaria aurata]|nr:hypothetical protein [Pseudocyphellaria aurata]
MTRCGKPVEELCRMSSNTWKENFQVHLLNRFNENDEIMNTLLLDGIGDCTTCTAYLTQQASKFDFTFGDTGSHRLAWASNGVLFLVEGSFCENDSIFRGKAAADADDTQ